MRFIKLAALSVLVLAVFSTQAAFAQVSPPAPNPQSDATGVEGKVNGAAPTQAATISVPTNGQVFTEQPITVSGLCPKGLLVEIYDNGVFVGSAQCTNSSFSLQISLFNGRNDLTAKVFDALNQQGPVSNKVTVTYNGSLPGGASRPTITTAYAKRGADPGTELSWPITISGGTGPYAVSVDWGDNTTLDLISREAPGSFNLTHIYEQSGIYNVTIKVTDKNGAAAFIQLVGVSNGPIQQSTSTSSKNGATGAATERVIIWWPLLLLLILTIVSFWLGKRHQLETIRGRLHRGERPI
jgi:hypothetical protein